VFFIFIKKNDDRIKAVFIAFVSIFVFLIARLVKLQLMPNSQVVSAGDICQVEKIDDTKFNIVDCKGKDILNFNKRYILVIDKKPFSLNNYEETLQDLLTLNFIMQNEDKDFSYESVMMSEGKKYYNISEESYDKINELKNIKGIYTYVYNVLDKDKAWSVEGIITNIPEGYKIPEESFDEQINNYIKNNQEVKKSFYLDEKSIYSKENEEVIDNNDKIELTIDEDMQKDIRNILNKDEFDKYNNVGVMIMESSTGEIKAMVQKDETQANINLGIEGMGYEPGSVYKLITLASALEDGKVSMSDLLSCRGKICKEEIHGKLSVKSALVKSCNDIFADIGEKVGYEKLMSYSERLGLFSPVLNLKGESRNEAEGIKPDKDSGMTNISIGQCLTVTPIQVLGFTNAIVNDGIYIKPHIIENILDNNNNVKHNIDVKEERVFSKTTSKLVKNAMIEVVNSGTGKKAHVDGTMVGGKTGSATGSKNTTHGWFSGYFISNNKTYTMTVFVPDIVGKDKDGGDLGGGTTAAPIFNEIVRAFNCK